MKILFPYFRRYWLTVLAAGLSVAAATLTALWIPRLLQSVLNALTANHQHQLIQYGVQLTTVGILGVIFGILAVFFAAKVTQGVTNDLRADLYAQIQSFSYANINQFSAGSLVVRLVNDMNQVMNLVMNDHANCTGAVSFCWFVSAGGTNYSAFMVDFSPCNGADDIVSLVSFFTDGQIIYQLPGEN